MVFLSTDLFYVQRMTQSLGSQCGPLHVLLNSFFGKGFVSLFITLFPAAIIRSDAHLPEPEATIIAVTCFSVSLAMDL